MRGGQEAGTPIGRTVGREAPRIRQHHEYRQVLVQAAQAVAHPGAHAGEARQHEAGVLHKRGRAVHVRLRHHRMDEGDVIDALGQMGQQAADVLGALAVLLPLPGALHDRPG